MTPNFFDRAYQTTGQQDVKDLYEDWAATYDTELVEGGYQSPIRCAAALALHLTDRTSPVLDFACGSGLSGLALAGKGFTTIDGVDISAAMLENAKARNVYRTLSQTAPGEAPSITPGDYAAITAVGALTPGAAPPEYFDLLLDSLAPGGLLVFSYNDHTMSDPDYTGRRDAALASGRAEKLFEENGIHIAKLGSNAMVYVFRKVG